MTNRIYKPTKGSNFLPMSNYAPKKHKNPNAYIIFDGMNIAYQAYYAYSKLSYKGKSVSILFGFLKIIKTILQKNQWNIEKVIIAWDGKKSKRRLKWLPTYKGHREEKRDPKERAKFLKQVKSTRNLIRAVGIAQAWNSKVEGDDMMALLTQKYGKLGKVIIVSGDKDMLQLVNNDVSVYNQRKDSIEVPQVIAIGNYGMEAYQWVDFLCLCGDSSDDIPGIRGIGESRASKFLKDFGSIDNYLKNPKAEYPGLLDKDNVTKIIKRNKKLIDLNWYINKYHSLEDITFYKDKQNPVFDETRFLKIVGKYNLKSLNTKEFKDFFIKISS